MNVYSLTVTHYVERSGDPCTGLSLMTEPYPIVTMASVVFARPDLGVSLIAILTGLHRYGYLASKRA